MLVISKSIGACPHPAVAVRSQIHDSRGKTRMHLPSRLALVALLALLLPACAQAAFPGANGKIAFDEDTGGHAGVFTVNPDGTGSGPLADGVLSPKLSPDGERLLAGASQGGNRDVWV